VSGPALLTVSVKVTTSPTSTRPLLLLSVNNVMPLDRLTSAAGRTSVSSSSSVVESLCGVLSGSKLCEAWTSA